MQQFAGGVGQAGYMDRIRALTPEQCLVVPVDVGKKTAMMLVADHFGHVVCGPIEFTLTTSGLAKFVQIVIQAQQRTAAGSVRVGIEAAGHYHWALAAGLRAKGFDDATNLRMQARIRIRLIDIAGEARSFNGDIS